LIGTVSEPPRTWQQWDYGHILHIVLCWVVNRQHGRRHTLHVVAMVPLMLSLVLVLKNLVLITNAECVSLIQPALR
jgi:hypothetical protein